MSSGIYQISGAGRYYVGQSLDVHKRLLNHLSLLRRNKHHNTHLQNAWNKHGEKAFRLEVLAFVPAEELDAYEQALIDGVPDRLKFNISTCAEATARGLRRSVDTIARMSAAQRGRRPSVETLTKQREAAKRPEVIAAKNAHKIGKPRDAATRAKLAQANRGKKHSEETRAKMSAAQKARWTLRKAGDE